MLLVRIFKANLHSTPTMMPSRQIQFQKKRMRKTSLKVLGILLGMLLFYNCTNTKDANNEQKLFKALTATASGINFENKLTENDSVNYFNYMYIYMGGGVAIGDLNNDGLPDIYFTGNMVPNKLYLNRGNLKFEDITEKAGVAADDRWVTGVTMGDANQDGWLDIYVSVSGKWTTTKNLLFLNDAKEGQIPTFTEVAERFGIADEGNSTQAVFFDYDLDGDQDLYVANYPIVPSRTSIVEFLKYRDNAPYHRSDRLYENQGNDNFVDVTKKAKLAKYSLSLGVSVGDYNQDGWPDMYVSNDFSTPDYFLINNKDGTFTDQNLNATNHTAYFGMGSDVADFNNDGFLDLYQVDMMPKSHRRAKENMDSMDPERFNKIVSHNMHHQYSINTLQLNMGNDQNGIPHFGDVARIAGVSSTDWSWGALFADFDNDGFKDIYVTNGVRRDINNSDYFRSDNNEHLEGKTPLDLTKKIPSEKIENYAFKNNGDLTFANVSKDWGVNFKGFSNGVAYADLDNDGDLDLVVNNLDDPSMVYENKTSEKESNRYLRIKLEGPEANSFGLGCKIWLTNGGQTQFQELTLSRGFQSSVEPVVHFGVGESETATLRVLWPDGKEQVFNQVVTNQSIVVAYENAGWVEDTTSEKSTLGFEDITTAVKLKFKHVENKFDDFRYQVLLPHKISEYGPALAVADIDNDGLDDFYIGGASRFSGKMFHQNNDGTFSEINTTVWEADKAQEDVSATFFDANGDGLQDLYVVCGGNEYRRGSSYYQDKFYINKGDGTFEKMPMAIPKMTESGATVAAADYDNDGDIDLFVGGRVTPRNYPAAPKSTILRNDSDGKQMKFVDVTKTVAPDLTNLGMVTQAQWIDVDGDLHKDLMLVGEWMGITYLKNEEGNFIDKSDAVGFEDTMGWWYGLTSADLDADGDIDFIAGNLGKNYKYQAKKEAPFSLYTYDYDGNGKKDIVLSKIEKGTQVPVRGRECSSQQIPAIKVKFKDYHSFATASLEQIYSKEHLAKSTHYEVKDFASVYIENLGNGQFTLKPLDNFAQIAPINTMLVHDLNTDGKPDVIYAGNLYGSEVETPRGDASFGGVLMNDEKGVFHSKMPYESGLMLTGEVKVIKKMRLAGGQVGMLCAKNNDYLQLVKLP